MFIFGVLSWWYGKGWKQRLLLLKEQLLGIIDYFSIDLLIRTFFSPFRQISAGRIDGPIDIQIHAFFDQLVSRIIGASVRGFMIIIGSVAIISYTVLGLVAVLVWALLPVLPLIGIVLTIIGWMPWIR